MRRHMECISASMVRDMVLYTCGQAYDATYNIAYMT